MRIQILKTGGHCSTYQEMANQLGLTNWEPHLKLRLGTYRVIGEASRYFGIEHPDGRQHVYYNRYYSEYKRLKDCNEEEIQVQ